jgi:hypothetical protein
MDNKKEIIWNIVNSLLAGSLVFFGAFTTGNISLESVCIAFGTSAIVAIIKFRDYWTTQEGEYKCNAFNFI